MLNIVSLSAVRDKITWPWKVIKNLMKWLDLIWYPYVINYDLNSTKRLLIHDDIFTIKKLNSIWNETKVILWPNLYNMPKNVPKDSYINKYTYLFPSKRINKMWKYFWYKWNTAIWPAWIDTYYFTHSNQKKEYVLIYFKTRFKDELYKTETLLKNNDINYFIINYDDWYKEKDFIKLLIKTKYVIWIWRQETQWIALQEVLSCNIPILVWDINKVWDWYPIVENQKSSLTEEELNFSDWVTSAEYFDESCWIKIKEKEKLKENIEYMEKNYQNFKPRDYILNNLSLEKQARDFIELFNKHYWITFEEWLNEILFNNKKLRNNKLLNLIFKIYDSKTFNILIKLKNKILW